MTDAINTQNRMRNTTPPMENKGQAAQQGSHSQTSPQTTSSTVVDIKSTQLLETMSAEMEKVPDMDMSKVDAIKQSITNGDYQPNAEVIAQKFTEIERLL